MSGAETLYFHSEDEALEQYEVFGDELNPAELLTDPGMLNWNLAVFLSLSSAEHSALLYLGAPVFCLRTPARI